MLESSLDDCTGEQLGFLQERLFALGVRDAIYIPIYMKKNRPAYLLQVLCDETMIEKAEDLIFAETTTIGIRRYEAHRSVLERRMEQIDTKYGRITMKVCRRKEQIYAYPEYEDVKGRAIENGQSYRQVYDEAVRIFQKKDDESVKKKHLTQKDF